MKHFLLCTLLLFSATAVCAQQKGTLVGNVIDADSRDQLPGAVITIAPAASPDKKQYFSTGTGGALTIPPLTYGSYKLTVSFLGYEQIDKTVKVAAAKVNVGTIELKSSARLDAVVTVAHAIRASQRGDTISYNAGSFRVASDADVEGLLEKMPGLTVTDGTIEVQGEQVQKIFVDGKEFFGDDPQTAIKSLPAEAVDRVEVFDKLSDAAEFSGMDDGEGYKAINIITKKNMRQGIFGKVYGGYGYDFAANSDQNKYLIGGSASLFSGDSRLTLLGLFNNVNQQNFSFDDILGVSGQTQGGGGNRSARQYMVRPQSGIAKVNSIGLNYSDSWGKENQITFTGSYFFNTTTTTNNSETDRWNEAPLPIDTLFTRGYSLTKNTNHRFNARFEWKISPNQDLLIRPRFNYQVNDPYSTTDGWQFGQSGISRTDNFNDGLRHGYNLNVLAVYRTKLGKPGRTLTLFGSVMHNSRTRNANSYSNVMPMDTVDMPSLLPDGSEVPWDWDPANYTLLRYLRNLQPSNETNLQGGITYTEPVGQYEQLSFQYQINNDVQHGNQDSYVTADDNYDIEGLMPDPDLSNNSRSAYTTHRVGPGFRYAHNKNTLVLNANYQYATLDGNILQSGANQKINHGYSNFTYFAMARLNFNPQNTLRIYARSYTDNPGAWNGTTDMSVKIKWRNTTGTPYAASSSHSSEGSLSAADAFYACPVAQGTGVTAVKTWATVYGKFNAEGLDTAAKQTAAKQAFWSVAWNGADNIIGENLKSGKLYVVNIELKGRADVGSGYKEDPTVETLSQELAITLEQAAWTYSPHTKIYE